MILTKEEIKKRFIEYNNLYFNNVLPMCKFYIIKEKNNQFGRYTNKYENKKLIGCLWISNNVNWTDNALKEVIIHEMIHHYIKMVEGKNGGIFGHNWRFKRQCKKLKKEFNITIKTHCYHLMKLKKKS